MLLAGLGLAPFYCAGESKKEWSNLILILKAPVLLEELNRHFLEDSSETQRQR